MKVLHLFSNTKWTGPAEPVVNLCATLQQRGIETILACSPGPHRSDSSVARQARAKALRVSTDLALTKHLLLRHALADILRLKRFIETERVNLIHAHLENDHLIGAIAARLATNRPVVLRTSYHGDGLPLSLRTRLLLRAYTDGLIVCSKKARSHDMESFSFPEDRLWTVYGAVDTDRFNPERPAPDLRRRFRLSDDLFVVGVVARIQRRRKFDVLLDALARASADAPTLRAMIVGRGTRMREVVVEPAQRLQVVGRVVLPGYLGGDDYVGALKALDAIVFLVPGTDGTCRALLEAMAIGKPAIVANVGVLPEVVRDGVEGIVVPHDPRQLASAIVRLLRDRDLQRQMGSNAHARVVARFSLHPQAQAVELIYRTLLPKQ